jgi:predicted nucleic acid-binding protein
MTACFADTYYFLALLNARDDAHSKALEVARTLRRPLITTTWVLTELADGLAGTSGRAVFSRFLTRLRGEPRTTIVPATDALFEAGVALYDARPDKHWSLTDCVSFAVMTARGISDALTADHHFEQAGFGILLKR